MRRSALSLSLSQPTSMRLPAAAVLGALRVAPVFSAASSASTSTGLRASTRLPSRRI
ncbi:MAG: hypothetical protein M5U35_00630 [Roseovarius sp.]|nr:hypothetical protein [Roseovarius sp.]